MRYAAYIRISSEEQVGNFSIDAQRRGIETWVKAKEGHIVNVTALDKIALVTLSFVLLVLGIYPTIMVPLVQSGVQNIMRILGGA